MQILRVLSLVILTMAWVTLPAPPAFAEGFTVELPTIEGTTVDALQGSNRLRKTDSGFVILTEIPVQEIEPGAASWKSWNEKPLLVNYQIGILDNKPLFIRIAAPRTTYRGLSEALTPAPDLERDFEKLLESAAAATGTYSLQCKDGRRCVETCSIGGRTVCCKYECR